MSLNVEQQREFHRHPMIAEAELSSLPPLKDAALILLQRKESIDGSGYPHRLKNEEISAGAGVLAVICDYFELLHGFLKVEHFTSSEALLEIERYAGSKYREEVVSAFKSILPEMNKKFKLDEADALMSESLVPGMVLARDLKTLGGTLLLSEGKQLDQSLIDCINKLEHQFKERLDIRVQLPSNN